jgi:hypothetical protein
VRLSTGRLRPVVNRSPISMQELRRPPPDCDALACKRHRHREFESRAVAYPCSAADGRLREPRPDFQSGRGGPTTWGEHRVPRVDRADPRAAPPPTAAGGVHGQRASRKQACDRVAHRSVRGVGLASDAAPGDFAIPGRLPTGRLRRLRSACLLRSVGSPPRSAQVYPWTTATSAYRALRG